MSDLPTIMPGDKNQKGVKTVQTMLAAKKTGENQCSKDNPPKRDKRTHSDVAEDSVEGIDMISIHSDLSEIKLSLQATCTKTDLESAVNCLVKQTDLDDLVTTIVNKLLVTFKESVSKEIEIRVREHTGKLQDKIDSFSIEIDNLKEKLREKDKIIVSLEERVVDVDMRSADALKLGNFNEQYSRKHNIRVLNFPEKKDENLREEFVKLVNKDLKVDLSPGDVQAIHRIPGKNSSTRPIIVKVKNTDIKIKIMKKKKDLKQSIRFHDDITQRNLGLMARLKKSEKFESVWFYNCSVYAKQSEGSRIKFDIFDNIEEKLRKKR